ncbi:SDR family NAD(P)-dependent oxidoreductase [Actinoplanes palleronii]|uniref:SDR family NAD(P)-dependent oxidoreductase n=1 Tax=Actinoplanes palleronii TaxID=113570 RepID=A0ABQ4BP45_9ACTN|nr:SDR family NAD(P)-dependent oxidoreductase [Actinoplanes palleronii]GIE72448.1 SDR family NAD(P)-dependent oxidoreductase [Actinoplanes palleronii]
MTITLITGGNKGLGYETARRLVGLGHKVYLGARDEARGRAAAERLGAHLLVMDVAADASVAAAAAMLTEHEDRLDVLINNAGVFDAMVGAADATAEDMRRVYDVNVFGIVRVTRAFLPLLEAADAPAIVNVGSGLGSFGIVTDPGRFEAQWALPVYASSKAAVGMLTVQYAKALPGIRINAADPGPTATDFTNNQAAQTVREGAEPIVRLAALGGAAPTGTYSGRTGTIPW